MMSYMFEVRSLYVTLARNSFRNHGFCAFPCLALNHAVVGHIYMRRTPDTACSLPMFTQIPPQTNGLRYGDDGEKELLMKICIKEQRFFNVRTVRGAFIGSKKFSFLHTHPTKVIHCCSCYESEVCQFCPSTDR